MARLSVVITSWNTRDHLWECLHSLEQVLALSGEVIVVDNASTDGSQSMIPRDFPHVRLLKQEKNIGYVRAVNEGVERSSGDFVLLLHSDVVLEPGVVKSMLSFLEENERYGAIAPQLTSPSGEMIEHSLMSFPGWKTPLAHALKRARPNSRELSRVSLADYDYTTPRDVEHASAACLMLRRKALRKRPMDEAMWLYFADLDMLRRLAEGNWRVAYDPSLRVYHSGGASTAHLQDSFVEWHKSRLTYYRKHYGRTGELWVRLCLRIAMADHVLEELWSRAHGIQEVTLRELWRAYGGVLKTE